MGTKTVRDNSHIHTVSSTLENGKTTDKMEGASSFYLMAGRMMVNGAKTSIMDKVNLPIQIIQLILVTLKMEILMAMENSTSLITRPSMENGSMVS
jgi:hypothetical protein